MHSLLSLSGGRVRRQSRELVTRYLQPGIRRGANRVLPSSWGTTIARLHMFQSDAGRTACTRPYSAAAWPLLIQRQRLPRWGLSTLNSMASGLAVYASPSELPQLDARLASSCWSGSTGRAFHPQGSDERFPSCRLHLVLHSQAWLGAMDVTSARKQAPGGRVGTWARRARMNRKARVETHRDHPVGGGVLDSQHCRFSGRPKSSAWLAT